MGKRKERRRENGSSSSYPSSGDWMSTEETIPVRSSDIRAIIEEAIRKTRSKEAKGIKRVLKELKEEINEMHKELKKLNENHIVLRTQLEQLNGSSGDGSPAPRSEPNQMQPPRFSLKIKSKVGNTVEKGKSITTDHEDSIVVDLYDGSNPIAPSHPLASAKVMMVVLDGNFNNSRRSWPKVDFEKSIKRPRQRNSTIGDVNQGIESIVSNCVFDLDGGTGRHSGATIWENSGNSKVKLGVMVLPDDSYGEYKNERVLEGVTEESFLVRDPPRTRKKQKEAMEHFLSPLAEQERNGPMPNTQYLSWPTINTQTAGNRQLQLQACTTMPSGSRTPRDDTHGVDPQRSVEPWTNQQPSSFFEGHCHISAGVQTPMISDSMNQTMHSRDGGVQPWISDLANQPMHGPYGYSERFFPVQVPWDRPGVEPSKRWNLLDQLMPLYSSQTKIHSGDFPTMRFMPEHYDSLTTYSQGPYKRLFFNEQTLFLKKMMRDLQITTIPKEVMQTRRNRGVLIQPLEPDDSDDEPPLKRKLRNKYQLRFVNKVCEAYYTGEKIKADDGNLLNVALYDENNAKITSGPLSSASVEVVVLHGDFNATGQDYWTSEEFSSSVVCPQSTKEPPAVGGDCVLVLVDGQASLGDAFFQKSSIYARTGKFKMGVMLASTPDERVQEGISEPFWVWNRKGGCTGFTVCQRWHRAINTIIFIWRLQSKTYWTRSMRRPLLSRDIGDACLELLKEQQCMQDSLLDAWTSGVEGFEVQLPKAAVMKNVTLLDPRNKGKGTPYHKMLIKRDIRDVQNEEYLPFADVKENDNEDAAEEAHDGNSGKEKVMEPDENHGNRDAERSETAKNEKEQQQDKQDKEKGEKEEANKRKAIARRSNVWEHFTRMKIGDTAKAKCKHCSHELRYDRRYGTSHLYRHLKGCECNPNRNTDPNQGTPYHKMLKKGGIFNVKDEEYIPFVDIKKNDNEDAAEVTHDGNSGKEKAATVAQLVGADAGGLISMIMQAAVTARQNKKECEQLARRVFMIAELLPHLQDPEVMRRPGVRRPLAGLGDTLREAHKLVTSCQGRSAAYRFVTAGRQADRFREVQSRIDSYLLVFPFISHIDITCRLDRIYNILLSNDTSVPSAAGSQSQPVQEAVEVAQEVVPLPHGVGAEEFTFANLAAATNNFALDTVIGKGGYGTVYKGRLHDGREVAIKRMIGISWQAMNDFRSEMAILPRLRHKHIVRLFGWNVQKEERLLVYEFMNNGSLDNHLHHQTSSSSPVTTSWKMRIEILLGVSRAIEYLHCYAVPPVIHGDIKLSNILLDASWVPCVSDFGVSITYDEADGKEVPIRGTCGYLDPEYITTGRLKPTSDVYNFGVVMLEVLTGKNAITNWEVRFIEAGEMGRMLDRRPSVPEPTPRQLEAVELVAQTAARCLRLQGKDRPVISDVVADLETALELVHCGE